MKTAKKNAFLFVIGGIGDNSNYINTIEKYDIEKSVWSNFVLRNPVEMNMVGPFSCQINEQEIFLFGGYKFYLNNETEYGGNNLLTVIYFLFNREILYK